MSKPRWIDGGVFKDLRAATRARKLVVFVGPKHGTAAISSRAALREALGGANRASLSGDPRCASAPDAGLAMLFRLRQPGIATTSVSDALPASLPEDLLETPPRVFGPDSKGLKSAYERKEPFLVRLCGAASAPELLVLTAQDRKALLARDSRYQAFLRETFKRTVLFTGFDLDDPDLIELLDDVVRTFNGHAPANLALVPAESTDPVTALRANMHYGTSLLEYPADFTPARALEQLAGLLEDLEVPKPASGHPPSSFTEVGAALRGQTPAADADAGARFAAGDSSSWTPIAAGLDAARDASADVLDFLLADAPEHKVPMVLIKGALGEGKTTLLRRLAWDLSARGLKGLRVFWRDRGTGLPDSYVPAEAEDARAVFVLDGGDLAGNLPVLLRNLAANGAGKARFLVAADADAWDRSGLDHRVRPHVVRHDVLLAAPSSDEAARLAAALEQAGRLPAGGSADAAAASLLASEGPLLDRISRACTGGSLEERLQAEVVALEERPDATLLKRAFLAVALVHQHGMSLGRTHLARITGLEEAELDARVIEPLAGAVIATGGGAFRTHHPLVAATAVSVLAPDEAARDALAIELLATLAPGNAEDPILFHQPSELIRARRQAPMPPLVLGKFFEAGAAAARHDVNFWFDCGRFEAGFSRWAEALAAFDQALWRQPGDATEREHNAVVQANRARCLQSLQRKKEALQAVDEGLRCSPRDAALLRLQEKLGGRRRTAGGSPVRSGGPRRRGAEGGERARDGAGRSGGRPGGPGAGRGGPGRPGPGRPGGSGREFGGGGRGPASGPGRS